MIKQPLAGVVSFLRRTSAAPSMNDLSDADLLERSMSDQTTGSFDALMRRYSRLVWSVCRRVAHDPHDAEDAFQATFLVLVRKAAEIDRRRSLGSWLWGVAYRAALKANAQAARRRARERQVDNMAIYPSASPTSTEDVRRELDAAFEHLPEKYRAPLILCYLEGKTNAEAAHELGWPIGSISKRLARGRELLRRRMAQRGTLLTAGMFAALLTENATTAATPAPLAAATTAAMRLLAAGQGTIASCTSPSVAALTRGVLRVMRLVKLRFVLGWVVTACLAAGISGASLLQTFAKEAAPNGQAPSARPQVAETAAALKLPPELAQIVRVVKPRADETKWQRIPWLTDLAQAQQVAKKERRPLFLFVSGDDPLEAC